MAKIDKYAVNVNEKGDQRDAYQEYDIVDRTKPGVYVNSNLVVASCRDGDMANRIALLLNQSEE